ncbi:MAG: hypothetical protein AAF333_04590 [Planctomycetota bacterium]
MQRWVLIAAGLCLGLGGMAGPAAGQYSSLTPKRLVESFDFEDINDQGVKLGRGLTLPPAWYPAGRAPQSKDPNFARLPLHDRLSRRPGFPLHNYVGYSRLGDAASGDYSLHLSIDGGSAAAYLALGTLPAVPGSDYLVTARVKTSALEHAGARVRTYFVDPAGKRLETSMRATPRLRTDGEWTDIDLTLPGEFAEAAYLGIELELVQPSPDPRSVLGNHQIVLTDVKGQAWFDDIAVWQLPHVEIGTGSAVNVTRSPRGPFWDVAVRDLVGGRLTARVTIYDHQRNVIATDRRPMGWGAPSKWRWSPKLPGYGWYLAELAVLEASAPARAVAKQSNTITFGGPATPAVTLGGETEAAVPEEAPSDNALPTPSGSGQVLARTYNAVLWLPPGTGPIGADAERFALSATHMSPRQLSLLPELSQKIGLGAVIVSAWDTETTLGGFDLRLEALQEVIAPLKNAGRSVELSFSPVPEELEHTRGVNSRFPIGVFRAEQELWMPYVQPILVRQGQRVGTWHVGSPDFPEAAYLPELIETVAGVYEAFRHWTPAPKLALPWRVDQPGRPDLTSKHVTFAVQWPAGVTPDRLADHMAAEEGWAAPGAPRRFQIRPPSAAEVPHSARVTDLALRMVTAWERDATGVALPGLWTKGLERRESLLPDPLLGVASNVATRLAGYRAVGRLELGGDRVAVVFERKLGGVENMPEGVYERVGDGMLAVWNVRAPASRAKLSMFLGEAPVVHDVWGNSEALSPTEEGKHEVALTQTPIFITGIDAKLALFRSGFVLDEPFVESTQTPHLRTIQLVNPWGVTVSGFFNITGPEDWTVRPRRHRFSIAPGGTLELPIALKFPINEVAGPKRLTADIEFTADRRYNVEIAAPMVLGLEGVRFEPSLAIEPGKVAGTVDAAVTCIITNTGQQELSLNVFANLPGQARKERLIPRLEPGQAVIRQFRFVDAAPALAESDIRLGVRETNGPAVLNKRVGVNDVE